MKVFFYVLAGISLLITGFFLWISVERAGLDYNSEGRYFDPELSVVYTEGGQYVYGLFSVFWIFIAGLFFTYGFRMNRNSTSSE